METLVENRWYTQDFVEPWWTPEDYTNFAYEHVPFNDPAQQAEWESWGFDQARYTGELYGMPNPEPSFLKGFKEAFAWKHFSWQLYRMMPGTTLPCHADTYKKFREVYGVEDPNTIWRAVVFLEDWQSGHYFEIDGKNLSYWKKGDFVVWQNAVKHLAANIGQTPRYTMQITGVIDNDMPKFTDTPEETTEGQE